MTKTYRLSDEECFSLLGAIEARIREMEGVIEAESGANPEMAEAAALEVKNLHRVMQELEFE